MPTERRDGPSATWIAFLAMAFAVVGLIGLFATFGAPLPLQRALARDATLDEALIAAHGPNPQAGIEALRDRLDDSAALLLPVSGDMDARIAQARATMRKQLLEEADVTAVRLRWLICLVTLMAAVFGAAVMNFARRAA